jgi:hypothetical protein
MVEEIVWVGKECVGPRLRSDEVWLVYRLVDNRCWLLRRRLPPLLGIFLCIFCISWQGVGVSRRVCCLRRCLLLGGVQSLLGRMPSILGLSSGFFG